MPIINLIPCLNFPRLWQAKNFNNKIYQYYYVVQQKDQLFKESRLMPYITYIPQCISRVTSSGREKLQAGWAQNEKKLAAWPSGYDVWEELPAAS